jgi:hypothetical protein
MTFFPFHPLRLRLVLLAVAVFALVLAAWGVADAQAGETVQGWARAGLALGFFGAFIWLWHKLSPRDAWGVTLGSLTLKVSRPMKGDIELAYTSVQQAMRNGKDRDTLVIFTRDERRILLPSHLFPSRKAFEAAVAALEEKLPAPRYDA